MGSPEGLLRSQIPPPLHEGAQFWRPGGVGMLTKAYVGPFAGRVVVETTIIVGVLDETH